MFNFLFMVFCLSFSILNGTDSKEENQLPGVASSNPISIEVRPKQDKGDTHNPTYVLPYNHSYSSRSLFDDKMFFKIGSGIFVAGATTMHALAAYYLFQDRSVTSYSSSQKADLAGIVGNIFAASSLVITYPCLFCDVEASLKCMVILYDIGWILSWIPVAVTMGIEDNTTGISDDIKKALGLSITPILPLLFYVCCAAFSQK